MIIDYDERAKEERKASITDAFYSAYFYRLKKLSGTDLEEILKQIDEPESQEEMSDEQMFVAAKRISATFGG